MGRHTASQRAPRTRKRSNPKRVTWRTEGDPARVLALDPSSVCVGWALFKAGQLAHYGRYLQIGDAHGERLLNFQAWLTDLIHELQPTTVTFEAAFQGRHRNAFAVLTLYRAAILAAHFDALGYELADGNRVPAHVIKRSMGLPKGTHDENKRAAVEWVNHRHGLNLRYVHTDKKKDRSQDDIADAIALGDVWYMLWAEPEASDG